MSLPNEMMIESLWFCAAIDILHVRLLNKFHRELVDKSPELQLIIQLAKDGMAPAHRASSASIHSMLTNCTMTRRRWNALAPLDPVLSPPTAQDFNIYEFGGSILAYCTTYPGESDCVKFISLDHPKKTVVEPVILSFKCFELSCDPGQHLLVVVEDAATDYPVHLMSMQTGEYHHRAATRIFHNLNVAGYTSPDIATCISGDIISFVYSLTEARAEIGVSVVNWATGAILLSCTFIGALHTTLLSSRFLIVAFCTTTVAPDDAHLKLFDLETPSPRDTSLVLRLPAFTQHSTRRYSASYFLHGSNNAILSQRTDGTMRTGERDIVTLFIKATTVDSDAVVRKMLVFISRARLLSLAFEWSQMPHHSRPKRHVLAYETWTGHGKHTRWIDILGVRLMSHKSIYGSKCVCLANPADMGAILPLGQEGNSTDLCVLEFNVGRDPTPSNPAEKSFLVRSTDKDGWITRELDQDVRGGLPFRVRWTQMDNAAQWQDLFVDQEYLMARLDEGFAIYRV
ncbi:hypothetical protein PIIN_09557 [Serendipita indica DSM 11827]|uniref:F-box domain-containing protein n=1 Tax=Serendipita indica (strain DSM 11827) TaxID=1109443 RepID=G4TW74_SERID|nr:hypothetical protein PIIN_09557 [Serendipita indica DSM 11827]